MILTVGHVWPDRWGERGESASILTVLCVKVASGPLIAFGQAGVAIENTHALTDYEELARAPAAHEMHSGSVTYYTTELLHSLLISVCVHCHFTLDLDSLTDSPVRYRSLGVCTVR